MKDQYVGDENDFVKYGLLRLLARSPVRLTVDWMRTPKDTRRDGGRRSYLQRPSIWEAFDPGLFRFLQDMSGVGTRHLRQVEQSHLLPGALFFSRPVPDGNAQRRRRFTGLSRLVQPGDLLFLDPDNGLAVPSVPRGRRGSSKYVYPEELRGLYGASLSLLLYQHFPRVRRALFAHTVAARCLDATGASTAFSFRATHAMFVLLPRRGSVRLFRERADHVAQIWRGEVEVTEHPATRGRAAQEVRPPQGLAGHGVIGRTPPSGSGTREEGT